MGLLDHRRTWRYVVEAPPEQCITAFVNAFSGPGGALVKARWRITRSREGARATYEGRKGLGTLAQLTRTGQMEMDSAVGSTVTFEIEELRGSRTVCAMWLSESGRAGLPGLLGVTSDARFFRPYMRDVLTQLSRIDPQVRVAKGLFGAGGNLDAVAPRPTPEQEAARQSEWAAAVAVAPNEHWTCPVCGHAKNPGGRVRCAQCRTEIGRP